jgi:hypothetical protein
VAEYESYDIRTLLDVDDTRTPILNIGLQMAERLHVFQQFHPRALDVIIDQVPPRAWNADVILDSDHLNLFASHIQFMTIVLFQVLAIEEIEVCKRRSEVTQFLECFDIAFFFIAIASVPPAGLSAGRCYSWSRRTRRSRPWRR